MTDDIDFDSELEQISDMENVRDILFNRGDNSPPEEEKWQQRHQFLAVYGGPKDSDEVRMLFDESIREFFGERYSITSMLDDVWNSDMLRMGFVTYLLEQYAEMHRSEDGIDPWNLQNLQIINQVADYFIKGGKK